MSQNFTRSEYDHCVYFKSFNGIFIILVVYVDDMFVARKNMVDVVGKSACGQVDRPLRLDLNPR